MSVNKTFTQPPYRNLKQLQKLCNVASFDAQPRDGHMHTMELKDLVIIPIVTSNSMHSDHICSNAYMETKDSAVAKYRKK